MLRKALRGLAPRLPYLKDHMAYHRALEFQLTERDGRVGELEREAAERGVRVVELERSVLERDGYIVELEHTVSERDGRVVALEHEASERGERIVELERAIAESIERVAELEHTVSERDERASELERVLLERDESYSALKQEYDERWNWIVKLENEKKELLLKTISIGDFASCEYWENRYAKKSDSGSGSYGRLAEFKAETVNNLISEFSIKSLIDFGCGDGNQMSLLKVDNYVGVDASKTVIARHREKFASDMSKSFFHLSQRELYTGTKYDASLSQDVIFHLLERDVFEKYMDDLFNASSRIVIIYSSNHESYTPWPEFRHRNFTHYVGIAHPQFKLLRYIPNKYPYFIGQEEDTSSSDYYVYRNVII